MRHNGFARYFNKLFDCLNSHHLSEAQQKRKLTVDLRYGNIISGMHVHITYGAPSRMQHCDRKASDNLTIN